MLITTLLLGWLQTPQSPAPDRNQPTPVNGIQFVVNDEAVTMREFVDDLRRKRQPNSTPAELDRALRETFSDRVRTLLMEQGGRDFGYDEAIVKRYVDDSIAENIKDHGGIVDLSDELRRQNLDPQVLRDMKQRAAYRELWGLAVEGRQPGASGRVSVDRYVRPGRLMFEFERTPKGELGQPTVDYQSLFIAVELEGSAAQARTKADEVVAKARAGTDFTTLVREQSHSSSKVRDGWDKAVSLKLVTQQHPDLGEFLAAAAPGAVSDPIAERVDGELVAFRVVSSTRRHEPELDFNSARAQDELRERMLSGLGRYRRDRELARMLEAAYVWPDELFGGAPPSERR